MDSNNTQAPPNGEKKRRFQVPHTFVILFSIIVLVTIATYLVPAGAYERVEDPLTGRTVVDVNSFALKEQQPVNPFQMFMSILGGMKDASTIVFFVFIMGGSFHIIQQTGAINAAINSLLRKVQGSKLMIPLVMLAFSVLGFAIGAAEEVLPFIPIAILLARGLGYDDIVGMAMVSTGAAMGFTGGMLNPFTTGIGQGIAGIEPLYSGGLFRTVGYVFFCAIAIWHVMSYAAKVKKDPSRSHLYGIERDKVISSDMDSSEFSSRNKLIILGFFIGIAVMIYGVLTQGWFIAEISALFMIMAIVLALIGGMHANDIAKNFVAGCKSIVFGALVVGIARTILVVMKDGQIMDSIIYYLSEGLKNLPVQATSIGMFWMNSLINFFIPSGSGQVSTVMPIMSPLADIVGITRQTAVLCVTYGDAISNQIIPTSGALLAGLGIANIPYDKWLKYNWKLVLYWTIAATFMVAIAASIRLGPI